MSDMRAIVIESGIDSWLIRTYDPETVKHMIESMTGKEIEIRYLSETAMVCNHCGRIDNQTNFVIDPHWMDRCKCPRCEKWMWIDKLVMIEV